MFRFFILMISVLYFIRKINAQYNNKTNNIKNKGTNILECMLDVPKIFILAGWCNVDHHSTEYFIIGMFIIPKIDIADKILGNFSLSLKILKENIKST